MKKTGIIIAIVVIAIILIAKSCSFNRQNPLTKRVLSHMV